MYFLILETFYFMVQIAFISQNSEKMAGFSKIAAKAQNAHISIKLSKYLKTVTSIELLAESRGEKTQKSSKSIVLAELWPFH